MSEPSTEQVKSALDSLEDGETVTVRLKDGSEVTGVVSHGDEGFQVDSDEDSAAVEISADQVAGLSVSESTDGPE